jgi:hypothetical protein
MIASLLTFALLLGMVVLSADVAAEAWLQRRDRRRQSHPRPGDCCAEGRSAAARAAALVSQWPTDAGGGA